MSVVALPYATFLKKVQKNILDCKAIEKHLLEFGAPVLQRMLACHLQCEEHRNKEGKVRHHKWSVEGTRGTGGRNRKGFATAALLVLNARSKELLQLHYSEHAATAGPSVDELRSQLAQLQGQAASNAATQAQNRVDQQAHELEEDAQSRLKESKRAYLEKAVDAAKASDLYNEYDEDDEDDEDDDSGEESDEADRDEEPTLELTHDDDDEHGVPSPSAFPTAWPEAEGAGGAVVGAVQSGDETVVRPVQMLEMDPPGSSVAADTDAAAKREGELRATPRQKSSLRPARGVRPGAPWPGPPQGVWYGAWHDARRGLSHTGAQLEQAEAERAERAAQQLQQEQQIEQQQQEQELQLQRDQAKGQANAAAEANDKRREAEERAVKAEARADNADAAAELVSEDLLAAEAKLKELEAQLEAQQVAQQAQPLSPHPSSYTLVPPISPSPPVHARASLHLRYLPPSPLVHPVTPLHSLHTLHTLHTLTHPYATLGASPRG